MTYDAIVIGAGVTGCAVARELSRFEGRFAVLEKQEDVSEGASKANSGIVHAGFDAEPGTKKAYYNVKGAKMYASLATELGVPYKRNGALVLGFDEGDRATLQKLFSQGKENGVDGLRLLSREEVLEKEPSVHPDVFCALEAESSAVVSPYEMTLALSYHAAQNGVEFFFETPVSGIRKDGDSFLIDAGEKKFRAKAVIACAGTGAEKIRDMMSEEKIKIIPRRGEYYLCDSTLKSPFEHTMFQVPGKMGKGVLVTPTAHGNVLMGPSAEDVTDDTDTKTTRQGLDFVMEKCRRTWADASSRNVITTFSGVRAHEQNGDFLVGKVPGGAEGAFEAAGIESPGLSSAPAIGQELAKQVSDYLQLHVKKNFLPPVKLLKPFSEMSEEERSAACKLDANYGRLVCRCEQVTEAEIRDAIRRPVGATTVDGVKRRTRAGMGRCQGGFCSPRVLEILCEELHLSPLQIRKGGGKSFFLTGTLTKGEAR